MGRAAAVAATILLILLGSGSQAETQTMNNNEKFLNGARIEAKAFETEGEPERLRACYMALENVAPAQEASPESRVTVRAAALSLWLHLLQVLERTLDPRFNPDDLPDNQVQPPPTTGGVRYPPGAAPALIDDPRARAEYEQAIAANRAKADQYRLQIQLRRLDEQITPRAEAFIRHAYTCHPDDRQEVKAAILKAITNPQRQAGLLRACYEGD